MEGKDIIRALLWAAAAFFLWQMIAVRIWPPVPIKDTPPGAVESAGAGQPADAGVSPTGEPESTPDGDDALHVVSGAAETITIGGTPDGGTSPYRMAVTLTNVGASVVDAQLNDFDLTIDEDSPPYPILSEVVSPRGERLHSFTTEQLYVGEWDATVDLAAAAWSVEARDGGRVVFGASVLSGSTPVVHIRKTFTLPAATVASGRHDMAITYEVENRTDGPITVIVTDRGPVGLRKEDLRFNDRNLFRGTVGEEGVEVTQFRMQAKRETPLYRSGDAGRLAWTAVANKYFVVFESPRAEAGHDAIEWINAIKEVPVLTEPPDGPTSTFLTTTTKLIVPENATRELAFDLYLGPKDRKAFRAVPEYVARGYDEQVVSSYAMGACAFLTPRSFVRFMIWVLNGLKAMVFNYGVAIIILVLIVRSMLHPITKKGQVNMMRMQQQQATLAPKMEEIKKRCANDKQKMNQEIMKMYQEEGVNPATGMMSSCLPMFLQMPIWIALFTSLNFNIDMRHEPFCLWIRDLTAPDALFRFSKPFSFPLIGHITTFNLLPILVSISMFMQQKLMPKPKPPPGQSGAQADQAAQMQKIMPYMTLVFGLFFYNMPSGLNLYIGTSSFFGAIEQHRIRKHIEELKNQPSPAKKGGKDGGPEQPSGPKKTKGPSLFERLQKAAAEAQKVKSTRTKTKSRKG